MSMSASRYFGRSVWMPARVSSRIAWRTSSRFSVRHACCATYSLFEASVPAARTALEPSHPLVQYAATKARRHGVRASKAGPMRSGVVSTGRGGTLALHECSHELGRDLWDDGVTVAAQ